MNNLSLKSPVIIVLIAVLGFGGLALVFLAVRNKLNEKATKDNTASSPTTANNTNTPTNTNTNQNQSNTNNDNPSHISEERFINIEFDRVKRNTLNYHMYLRGQEEKGTFGQGNAAKTVVKGDVTFSVKNSTSDADVFILEMKYKGILANSVTGKWSSKSYVGGVSPLPPA